MADNLLPHERPLYLILPAGMRAGRALSLALRAPQVRGLNLPPPWFLERAGVDLPSALPDVRQVTLDDVEAVVEAAERLCTRAVLSAYVGRVWREADEHVRQHFLKQGALRVFASIFRLRSRSIETEPPPEFVAERIAENGFSVEYRLAPEPTPMPTPARPEEGSVVTYPFDPANLRARRELGLGSETGPIVEVFAYAWQHERHLAFWTAAAHSLGASLRLSE